MRACAILGFQINLEDVCAASGNHPLCRKCLGGENKRADPPATKRKIKKKCKRCPEIFFAKSNRQRFCERCQQWNETVKNREYQARFRKRLKTSLGVRV